MSTPMGMSSHLYRLSASPLPNSPPTGANPTFTPVRNKISPAMVYTKPTAMRSTCRRW